MVSFQESKLEGTNANEDQAKRGEPGFCRADGLSFSTEKDGGGRWEGGARRKGGV